ncbi:MAG: methylisocitrate lyase [Thermodesulfobacteriota bacterium]
MKATRRLRQLLAGDGIVMAPGAHDALAAQLIQQAGFNAAYLSGMGVANALAGLPDIGMITMTEQVMMARYVAKAVSIPVISDADTGYGNAVNVMRAIQEFETAGVAGVHLEDQVFPKRCGHETGKQVVSMEEAAGKIRAACAARQDPDFVIIARVDARAPLGLDEAVKRGKAYRDAGADVVFPEALESREEFAAFAKAFKGIPLLANMVDFGKSPLLNAEEYRELGYKLVIYPTSCMRVMAKAAGEFLAELKRTGTQKSFLNKMRNREEIYELVRFKAFKEVERSYLPKS